LRWGPGTTPKGVRRLRVDRPARFELRESSADDTSAFPGGKKAARRAIERLRDRLGPLQELLAAEQRHAVLVVLQGMDTAGKDATIRRVFSGVDPQGVRVANFRVPTELEAAHDFLWRIHRELPRRGEIVIFNRSHYEDVLVPRVHRTVPRAQIRERYRAIRESERVLAEEGTIVLKFLLHIDRKEQGARLRERDLDPRKRWKKSPSDRRERARWGAYLRAHERMVRATSTPWARWYVVPADRKWLRDWAVLQVLVRELVRLRMRFPESGVGPRRPDPDR
jgi:PPK2 family polyphosphate:nucleotide phosphotransferase